MLLANDAASRSPFVETLLGGLSNPDSVVRWRAALALGTIGADDPRAVPGLVAALSDPSGDVRRYAQSSLVQIGGRAASALVSRLPDTDLHAVVPVLGAIGGPAIDALVSSLSDREARVRWASVAALEDIGDERVVAALVGALGRPEYDATDCAVSALGHIGARAIGAVSATLADGDEDARRGAAIALGHIGDTRAFMPLIVALDDASPAVRSSAAWALGGLHDARAFIPLLVALEDEDAAAREGAAAGLGRFGDERGTAALISALDDEDERVRVRAVSSLGELGQRKAVPFLIAALIYEASDDVRHAAADALGELGKLAVVPLLEALDDEDEDARSWIALALDAVGAPTIEHALSEPTPEGRVLRREHIFEALGWIADEHEGLGTAV